MTLEETIKYHIEMAEEFRQEAEQVRDLGEYISPPKQPYNELVKACRKCAEEHEQLAEWLIELVELRNRDVYWEDVKQALNGWLNNTTSPNTALNDIYRAYMGKGVR